MDTNTSLNVQQSITTAEDSLALLEKVQGIIRIEKLLTDTLEKVQPWLPTATKINNNDSGTGTSNKQNPNKIRVRPIPRTMDEVNAVLAVSRTLSSRTSAPAGWNPLAPVVGFSTPAPLPNQLRSGSLAELQLNRARQDNKKRQKLIQQQQIQEQEQNQIQKQQRQQVDEKKQQQQKKQQESIIQKQQQQSNSNLNSATQRQQHQQQPNRPITAPNRPKLDVSMNLSDDDDSSDADSDSS